MKQENNDKKATDRELAKLGASVVLFAVAIVVLVIVLICK